MFEEEWSFMTRALGTIAMGVLLTGTVAAGQAPDPKLANEGKKLYATYKCDKCHQIDGRGSKKGPLDGVGAKLTAADIKKWMTDPAAMEAKLEKKPKGTDAMSYALKTKGIEAKEVDALVAYIQTLTKK
jgi:mono/diheme cytochrome c family protein